MFSSLQITLLVAALSTYVVAIFGLATRKDRLVQLSLFVTGVLFFSWAALLDPYIHIWDERFHALVAKNMMDNPLKPMLYADPVLDRRYDEWYFGHIWLHKQPLFMWQMALSMKLFGTSVFALRLPGVILSALTVVGLFRSGRLVSNQLTGFLAATLMLSSFYWMNLVSGRKSLDQNDVAFISYVSLSIWAWLEYLSTKKRYWLILIGLFAGAAVLCKWLLGVFVFTIWGFYLLIGRQFDKKSILDFISSLALTAVIAVPWQIYCYIHYKTEYLKEQTYNAIHLWKKVEGHAGDFWYYFYQLKSQYSIQNWYYLAIALVLFVAVKPSKLKFSLAFAYIAQFSFFTFAETKMASFTLLGLIIALLAIGSTLQLIYSTIYKFITNFKSNHLPNTHIYIYILTFISLIPSAISFHNSNFPRGENEYYNRVMTHNLNLFTSINLPKNYVLFNVNGMHYVEAMFYTGLTVYNGFPSNEQINELHGKGRRIAVIRGEEEIPEHISAAEDILIIEGSSWVCE